MGRVPLGCMYHLYAVNMQTLEKGVACAVVIDGITPGLPSSPLTQTDDCGCSLLHVKMKQVIPGYESENMGQGESLPGPIPLGGRGISTELFQTIDKISPPRSTAVVQCDVDEGNIEPPGHGVISPCLLLQGRFL